MNSFPLTSANNFSFVILLSIWHKGVCNYYGSVMAKILIFYTFIPRTYVWVYIARIICLMNKQNCSFK